jgi:hypothetical protein
MADGTAIGGYTKEYVALLLMERVRQYDENRKDDSKSILNLYAECLEATSGQRSPETETFWYRAQK